MGTPYILRMDKDRVAEILIEIGTLLELKGENPFKTRAYENAARALESLTEPLQKLVAENRLAEIEGIEFKRAYATRHLLSDALAAAEPMLDRVRGHSDVIRCSTCGSVRRHKELIGDIDFLASSKKPANVIEFFTSQPGVVSVSAKGDTKASVILQGGIQADLRVVSDAEFPYALMYFTGNKEHNIVMRQRDIERGLRLNEYGLFKAKEETRDPKLLVRCRTEEEIYHQLDLPYIPPELREDKGEFAAAENGELPTLVEWTDLKC